MTDYVQVPREAIEINYTNWRGERFTRNIIPLRLEFGSNEWHPVPQWLIIADDCDKGEERAFALAGFAATPQATDPREAEIERLRGHERTLRENGIEGHIGVVARVLIAEQDLRAAQAENEKLRAALNAILERDGLWSPSGMSNDCNCINLSVGAAREYEVGICPHQRARAALSPPPLSPETP